MEYSNISFENFYQGGDSAFNSEYGGFEGKRISASQLGFPGSPQTANQLGETVNALKQGVKAFEVTMLTPDTAETIPTQHFSEMRALMKLSGVKPSVHGPLIDAAGFDEKGGWGGESGRANNERRMFGTLEKAQILGPDGNIPVVFHISAGMPGTEWMPGGEGEDRAVMNRGVAINRETGQSIGLSREHKFRPGMDPNKSWIEDEEAGGYKEVKGGPAGILFSAEGSVDSANSTEWDKKILEVAEMNKRTEEIIGAAPMNLAEYRNAYFSKDGKKIVSADKDGKMSDLPMISTEAQAKSYDQMRRATLFAKNAEQSFGSAFHNAWAYGTKDQREELEELSNNYSEKIKGARVEGKICGAFDRQQILGNAIDQLDNITKGHAPELFQEAGEFASDKAATTFGNLAMKSYDKFEGKAPMIAIEPVHFGMGLSKTEEVMDVVEKARETFSKQLIDKKGLGQNEADKIAEEKIGVTWDVGHINMMKKYGFEDKDILEASEKIAPMVKHIHITDNFGHADTHLAPGMGNVPIKEILERLEKNGEFDKMRKIVEAGAFVQHFKKSPFPLSLAAFGSPIYGMKAGPGWNQVMDVQGSYSGGFGTINPEQHHSMYGAGFTTMPTELGGQMPGGSSRFGGTPMA
ncbi:sugar phosphate isomerase/epimerase [Candidatus Pacearchaeota archaeon]|nr:sugar phosphate isomerase/epimerase [Candidatus Pacearchaeota archaeon]